MYFKRYITSVLILFGILSGCAGVGVVETSNPAIKLSDARHLFLQQNRPLIAEKLIIEAMNIYIDQNDLRGMGFAAQTYGQFLRSKSVVKSENSYRKLGFRNEAITFENRLEKSDEYIKKSIVHFNEAESELKQLDQYDLLTNLYYNLAWSYYLLNKIDDSCRYYGLSMDAYEENIHRNPQAIQNVSTGYKSPKEEIEYYINKLGCNSNA